MEVRRFRERIVTLKSPVPTRPLPENYQPCPASSSRFARRSASHDRAADGAGAIVTNGFFSFARQSHTPKQKAVDNYRNENNGFATRIWQNFYRDAHVARSWERKDVEANSMVDDLFCSYRNHNTVACEGSETSRGGIGDLLAELARLTGQGNAYRNGRRYDRSSQAEEDDTSSEQRQQRGSLRCPSAPGIIPCAARARQAEETAVQQTRGQIQWLPWGRRRPSGSG
jgi:hypothetical protein